MKKLLILVLLSVSLVACGNKNDNNNNNSNNNNTTYKDGTYDGMGTGYNGNVSVIVTVKNGKIHGVVIGDNADDETLVAQVQEKMIPEMISKNTWDVDTVSGATKTSDGVIKAVESALNDAD